MPTRSGELIRFLAQFRRALKQGPVTREQAMEIFRRDLETRADRFVAGLERYVYRNPASPYLPLLRRAGFELGDVRDLVRNRGLEGALERLYDEGVYVTLSEFKCRVPIERGDLAYAPEPASFDRPDVRRGLSTSSGGSTGRPTTVWVDMAQRRATAVYRLCADGAMGLLDKPRASWLDLPPAPNSLSGQFRLALSGQRLDAWFAVPSAHPWPTRLRGRVQVLLVALTARSAGYRWPRPTFVALDQAVRIARWAAESVRRAGGCVVQTTTSRAVRVAVAAVEHGIDLSGVVVTVGGEPLTPAKRAEIERSGARVVTLYPLAEAGMVGFACLSPLEHDDVHVNEGSVGLIGRARTLPGTEETVEELVITTIGDHASKVLLNLASDDFARVDSRECGCPVSALGLKRRLRGIRSFSKLTGEAVTLLSDDALALVEQVLPARFGGSSLDYQLVEEEEGGLTRLTVLVSPHVPLTDEAAVVRVVLDGLGSGRLAGDIRAVWSQAGSVRVRREQPILTMGGKVLPIRKLGKEGSSG